MLQKPRLRDHPKQYLPHRLEMRGAPLDLLHNGMNVPEPPLKRRARHDRIRAGGLVGVVGDLRGRLDRVRAGQPHAGTAESTILLLS